MKFEKTRGKTNPFEIGGFHPRRPMRFSGGLSIEETFLDDQDSTDVLESDKTRINYRLLHLAVLLLFTILAGRIYFLQAIKGEEYRGLAEGNKLRTQYLLAPRGQVLDKFGKIIATNTPSFELVIIPSDLPQDEAVLKASTAEIAEVLGRPMEEIKQAVDMSDRSSFLAVNVAQNLTKDQALIIISQQDKFPGFVVQNNPIRDYKDPEVFAHLVGYTGKITAEELKAQAAENYLLNDNIGKTGLEIEYEGYLRGIPGKRQAEVDAQGNLKKTYFEVPSFPGHNAKLNVDYELQKLLYDSLLASARKFGQKRAAALATNPQTGQVLALVSLPSFDNNWFARGISVDEYQQLITDDNIPLLNRVVSGTYPPGSTVKPMLAVAALTEGVVTPSTKILDDGVIRIGEYTFYGYERTGLGLMDIYSAIAKSSDIYFYTVGGGNPKTTIEGLGPEKLAQWYRKFNLGTTQGIDIPSEKAGLVPDPEWKLKTRNEQWFLGNTYHYSIGQGDLLVTPLQVNSWTATLANGGKIMKPYILDSITDQEGKVLEKKNPQILRENFLDPAWVKVAQDGMRQAVSAGSARSLNSLPIEVAGKTGTAQFDARYPSRTHAWFTSYAPFEDPQIALTILVESGGEGSSVSVPVAKEVYEWWAQNRMK